MCVRAAAESKQQPQSFAPFMTEKILFQTKEPKSFFFSSTSYFPRDILNDKIIPARGKEKKGTS